MFLIKPEGERRKQGVGEESELCSPIYYLDSLRLKKKMYLRNMNLTFSVTFTINGSAVILSQ